MSYKNKNSKLLGKHLSKSNMLNAKSVTTYVNELEEEDNLFTKKEILSPNRSAEEDPTLLNNILNALKITSKGSLHYPQEENVQICENEVCDFKNIGDLSSMSFNMESSFVEEVCREDYEEDLRSIQDTLTLKNKLYRLDEERSDDGSENDEIGNVCNFSMDIFIGQTQMEQERLQQTQSNCLKVKDAYSQNLMEIRERTVQSLHQYRIEAQQNQALQQKKLQQMLDAAEKEATNAEEKYMEEVKIKKEEILREVEAACFEEEKKISRIADLIFSACQRVAAFKGSLTIVQEIAANASKESELHKIIFQELPNILTATEQSVDNMSPSTTTEDEINVAFRRVAEAVNIIEAIKKLLHNPSEEQQQAHAPPAVETITVLNQPTMPEKSPMLQELLQPGNSAAGSTSPPSSRKARGEPPPLYPVSQETTTTTTTIALPPSPPSYAQDSGVIFKEVENVYWVLKAKFNKVSEEANGARENMNLRPLLARAVGIVNTLSSEKHDSSNRGKLQQIFNLINGRTCSIGSDTISTSNNPSAQAFVKEQLAIRIVTLGHDKQVAAMGIYASLIVRLWQIYPEVGELILYKLYETCPFLVPLTIRRDSSQTDEEFNRSVGIRHKEGSTQESNDMYITRMGAAAQLYGRVVAMQVDNHPHGIQEGWKWMARTLTKPPYPSVTAAILNGFLSAAGAPLLNNYGKQFRKVLHFLCTSYLVLIEQDVLEGGHADVVGLKTFLTRYERTRTIPPIDGGYKLLL